jgi:hypothetical protein
LSVASRSPLTQHRHLFWLLDCCAAEVAELAGLYETAVRGRYFTDFTRFIGIVTTGRDLVNEEVAARARALFEMVAWMGMHRHRDRQPPAVSDDVAGKPSSRSRFWLCSAETRWTKSRQSHEIGEGPA